MALLQSLVYVQARFEVFICRFFRIRPFELLAHIIGYRGDLAFVNFSSLTSSDGATPRRPDKPPFLG